MARSHYYVTCFTSCGPVSFPDYDYGIPIARAIKAKSECVFCGRDRTMAENGSCPGCGGSGTKEVRRG